MTSLHLVSDDTELLNVALHKNALALEAEAEHLTRLLLDGAPEALIQAVAVTVREHCHTAKQLRQYIKATVAG